MAESNAWLKSLISAILLTGSAAAVTDSIADDKPAVEKCFGIAKKGMNDCAGSIHSCQGTSSKEGDPKDYLYVLKGTCQKIIGGIPDAAQSNTQDKPQDKTQDQ